MYFTHIYIIAVRVLISNALALNVAHIFLFDGVYITETIRIVIWVLCSWVEK